MSTALQERQEMRADLFAGRIPKRVPIFTTFTYEGACGLAGVDLKKAQYDPELAEKVYKNICETFYFDAFPCRNSRYPAVYQILGAKNWILGSNGTVQHPEIETLRADEYDDFIKNPHGFIMETLLPRVCANMDTDSVNKSVVLSKAYGTYKKQVDNHSKIIADISKEKGYVPAYIVGTRIEAPFDFLADMLRGFKATTMDIRRMPDKVEAACEAILPLMLKLGLPAKRPPNPINFIPLHLAPYINMKQFERLYWPTLEKLIVEMDKQGTAASLFAEEDWTRYAEFLERLPESTVVLFEYGDYAKLKATVGKKHVIGGFYNPTITLTRTKEECIDEAKRLIDTCAPDGRFYFAYDKSIIDVNSIDVSKLQAVTDWVYANANYR